MLNYYLFHSYSGNKYTGYSHICRHKSRHRTTCRLTLSYIPASQADADLIASYLPKPHADGSPILPSELPTSLPGYLINLKAQINLDGVAVATSSTALPMGTDLQSTGGFTKLSDPTQWDLTSEESNVVGQATAIGISAGGISAVQLTKLNERMVAAQTALQAGNTAGFATLKGEQVSGDLLTATIWGFFSASEIHNSFSQNQANTIEYQGLSYGLFHAIAQPVYSWGVIRAVKFPGVNMDIGHIRMISGSKNNDPQKWVDYNRIRGQYLSSLEHAIPEKFFNYPGQCNSEGSSSFIAGLPDCPKGISAVRAISLAAVQGQKIYTITQEVYRNNPNIVNTNLSALSYSVKQGIQNALDAGNEVSTHERPIMQSGWTGAGYIFIDPETGAGGYIIDGGSNGGTLITNIIASASCLPKSAANYLNLVLQNYKQVDDAFYPWWTSVPGTNPYTAVTSAAIADLLGGITLGQYVAGFRGTALAFPGLVIFLFTTILNGILINGALKTGILIGSIVSPKVLQETINSDVCK